MAPRYPARAANPNRVTLDLDPITSDALDRAARAGGTDRRRLAYELVQRGLGITTSVPAGQGSQAPAEPEDDATRNMRRGIDAIRKPQTAG